MVLVVELKNVYLKFNNLEIYINLKVMNDSINPFTV